MISAKNRPFFASRESALLLPGALQDDPAAPRGGAGEGRRLLQEAVGGLFRVHKLQKVLTGVGEIGWGGGGGVEGARGVSSSLLS